VVHCGGAANCDSVSSSCYLRWAFASQSEVGRLEDIVARGRKRKHKRTNSGVSVMGDQVDRSYTKCQENLVNLAKYYSENIGNRNEATTRLHLIDTLLFDCLAWEKYNALAEQHHRDERDEYTDYTFYGPRRIMILEAKREGDAFEVPAGKNSLVYKIKSLCHGNRVLKGAVEQAARYCQCRGVPIAVVSNGHQLVAFVANRADGIPPMDGSAMVFPSLHFMHDRFLQLWNALSRPGIEEKHLYNRLLGSQQPELPRTLAESISDYPGTKGRNVFQAELQTITELVIEDIPQSSELESEFLRCLEPLGIGILRWPGLA